MKVGVLQTGLVPEGMASEFGEYDQVFRDFLHLSSDEIETIGWRVVDDELPDDPRAVDLWIISGSRHGVYENHSWIEPLKDFIREIAEARTPLIGVCFGHQIMAEALGGRAEKWRNGWALGPKEYETTALPSWMKGAPASFKLHAVHQDQVTQRPPDATVIASNAFCENAALLYGDAEAPYAISIQPHPEFTDRYLEELIARRRGTTYTDEMSDAALAGRGADLARPWAADWFLNFARRASPKN